MFAKSRTEVPYKKRVLKNWEKISDNSRDETNFETTAENSEEKNLTEKKIQEIIVNKFSEWKVNHPTAGRSNTTALKKEENNFLISCNNQKEAEEIYQYIEKEIFPPSNGRNLPSLKNISVQKSNVCVEGTTIFTLHDKVNGKKKVEIVEENSTQEHKRKIKIEPTKNSRKRRKVETEIETEEDADSDYVPTKNERFMRKNKHNSLNKGNSQMQKHAKEIKEMKEKIQKLEENVLTLQKQLNNHKKEKTFTNDNIRFTSFGGMEYNGDKNSGNIEKNDNDLDQTSENESDVDIGV